MLVLISQKEPRTLIRKVPFWLRKVRKLSWFVLAIQICQLKKINLHEGKVFGQGIGAKQQKISLVLDTGLVKHGDDMKALDVLKELEKHEAECLLRYKNIEEKLSDQKNTLKLLDAKVWGIAVLVLVTPFAARLLG